MTLTALIRGKSKSEFIEFATAIPATAATEQGNDPGTVATIATIAVANTSQAKRANMTAEQENAIRAWLVHIEETDYDTIAEVLDKCRANPQALAYFLWRAEEVPSAEGGE